MQTTNTPPTERMLNAMAEAAQDSRRRIPSTYTANTTSGLVTRGLATPGTEHFLTAQGVQVLHTARPDTPIGTPIPELLDRLGREHGDLTDQGFTQIAFWGKTTTRYYPNGPSHRVTDLLEVPGVVLFGWSCDGCTDEEEKHDDYLDAKMAARKHATSPACVHQPAQ